MTIEVLRLKGEAIQAITARLGITDGDRESLKEWFATLFAGKSYFGPEGFASCDTNQFAISSVVFFASSPWNP